MSDYRLRRKDNESFDDFFVRLFEHKEAYGITCVKIAKILNKEVGIEYSESKWRKEYAAFARGEAYAFQKSMRNVKTRILCLSDLHVPFQLPVETFERFAGMTDILLLNGDITDCQAISKFPKAYRISPMQEIIKTREYLIELINYVQPKKVVVTYGNHDVRFQNYFAKSLDTDLLELMPKTSLELILVDGFNHYDKETGVKVHYAPLQEFYGKKIEIQYVNQWYVQIGKTVFCHPLAFASGIMKTADKALQYFRNEGFDFTSLVMGHTHRIGEYKVGNTVIYEQGCCCDVAKQSYTDGKLTPSQKEGYIYLCQSETGEVQKEHTHLVNLN